MDYEFIVSYKLSTYFRKQIFTGSTLKMYLVSSYFPVRIF